MSLPQELIRFDAVVAELFPDQPPVRPGLDDAGVEALRQAVAPLGLGADLETLYRWHDGLEVGVFGGKRMLSAAEIIRDREFQITALERPPRARRPEHPL